MIREIDTQLLAKLADEKDWSSVMQLAYKVNYIIEHLNRLETQKEET